MTKKELQKQMEKSYILSDTLEMRFFLPTENAVVYMQVGDGSQLDGDTDEDGIPYDGYLDYKVSDWDEDENCFREGDGGIFEYRASGEDALFGELYGRAYETLCEIYGEEAIEDMDSSQVLILPEAE